MISIPQKRPEIVAPAGNFEKLKLAVMYGADAVYFGGERNNLRVRSDNFTSEEIERASSHCRERGVRTIFLLNSFLHERDIEATKRFIREIRHVPFDAIMISDPGMIPALREAGIESRIHLSTQASVLNHLSVRFWQNAGIRRIVLARETTIDEIRLIRENTDAELEVFVHGALCIAYSGRCLLSRYLTGRDANAGDCAQACRWRYALVEEKRDGRHLDIVQHAAGTEIISSKDLCLIGRLRDYVEAGVDAFKIEGRMKSVYYTANVVRIYRHATERVIAGDFDAYLPFYRTELDLVSHRPYTDDLFNEFEGGVFEGIPYVKKAEFLGYVLTQERDGTSFTKTFNPIYRDETAEAIFPIQGTIKDARHAVREIIDCEGTAVEMARPNGTYRIRFEPPLEENAILRRRTG